MSVHTSAPGEQLLTLSEATSAGYAGYSTLRRYISDGRLPASKIGGRVRVRRADLDALLTPAKAELSFDELETHVARLAAAAPPLTRDQITRLGRLFGSH